MSQDNQELRKCSKCRCTILLETYFSKNRKGEYKKVCDGCSAKVKKYREENKDKVKEWKKKEYQKHKEHIKTKAREYHHQYKERNNARSMEYYAKNKERANSKIERILCK